MDCQHCEDQLTELALGLLSAEAESEVRAHLATCPSCRSNATVLEEGAAISGLLELEEPPARVRAAIVAQASEALAERRHAPAPVAAAEPPLPLGARILDVLRRWATGPQGAMATITLLVVAIGLFYLPAHRPPMSAEGDTVLSPTSPDVVAAVPAGAPPDVAAPQPAVLPTLAPTAPRREGVEPARERAAAADELRAAEDAPRPTERADEERTIVASAERERFEPAAEVADLDVAPAAPAQPMASTRARSAAPATAPMPAAALAQRAASADSAASATEAPAAAAPPPDLLSMARAQRSASRCAAAAPLYEQWLAQNPSSAQRGPAIVELSDCLRRTGRVEQARTWLERAAPTYAVARRELERMSPTNTATGGAPPSAASRAGAAARPAESPAAGAASSDSY